MTGEEVQLRARYLFVLCTRAVERCCQLLLASPALPASAANGSQLQKPLRRELGILFRYWATRQIWQRWESKEAEATQLNLALLRFFTDEFKLPKDGSGLRYAELSTVEDEVRELSRRIAVALNVDAGPLLAELHHTIAPSREAVVQSTIDALELPAIQLSSEMERQTI